MKKHTITCYVMLFAPKGRTDFRTGAICLHIGKVTDFGIYNWSVTILADPVVIVDVQTSSTVLLQNSRSERKLLNSRFHAFRACF
jgi:hypothetical protein